LDLVDQVLYYYRTGKSITSSKNPEGGWLPPTGYAHLREKDFLVSLPFTLCGEGPSGPAAHGKP
jgi:hypothetical protein